jgi:hypothetical protein
MGRIILTIVGPWETPPAFDTPLALEACPAEPRLGDVFTDLGRDITLDGDELRAIRVHRSLVQATAEFDAPGSLEHARLGAELMAQAFAAGAAGVFVETGLKVFGPGALRGLDLRDAVPLFHLYVDVAGDGESVGTEGMQAFDLPDLDVRYGAADREFAQAAAFGMAARMVCDRYRPADGGVYRNTESAPLYRVSAQAAAPDADSAYQNPRGTWVLQLA